MRVDLLGGEGGHLTVTEQISLVNGNLLEVAEKNARFLQSSSQTQQLFGSD